MCEVTGSIPVAALFFPVLFLVVLFFFIDTCIIHQQKNEDPNAEDTIDTK